MPPADSASRAGDMPEASGDSSSGTFAKNMNLIVTSAFSISLLCLGMGLVDAKEPTQAIRVFQDASPAMEGLSLRVSLDSSKESDSKAIYFILTVANLFSEEIFLGVTDFDDVSFSLEEHIASFNRIMSSGAGAAKFPDNTQLLKRLHAAIGTKDNATITCGCCAASIPIRISMDRDNGFSDWRGAPGVLRIPIRGFFRSSGREFYEYVEVPIVVPMNLKQK